ncbi:MAG TPA: TIGR02266 family protein [Myxococcota bacterium]|nr:TIGR02266 family protein [Myxococcota bacterium]HRY93507.1 TIGR02266 family protein [Myxococcota bacterium]HSA21950.1 TIGR02266 family protein [Myxococcota bacterium]
MRGADLLESVARRGPLAVVFVPTARQLELGEEVNLLLDFPAARRHFRLRARIIARRIASSGTAIPPGVELEVGSEQLHVLQLALDCAAGKSVDFIDRSSRRVPCEVVVEYRTDQGFVRDFAEDIGAGGTFLRTERLFPVGTQLEVKLKPPGYLLGVRLRARVAWVKTLGRPRGMGLEFLFSGARQQAKLARIVERLSAEHARRLTEGLRPFRDRARPGPG